MQILVHANDMIDEDKVAAIEDAGVEMVKIRSVLTCQSRQGVCVKCYGRDLGRGHQVNMGEAIGTMAAQSIWRARYPVDDAHVSYRWHREPAC